MILSDTAILEAIHRGTISIEPFEPQQLGGNSYDVRLSKYFATYFGDLDCKAPPGVNRFVIDDNGLWLEPSEFYLASTMEQTKTLEHVPYLDGKSSVGRMGISIHVTAGRGDVGFHGHWTMEITVKKRVKVYPGMPIAQVTFHTVEGHVMRRYDSKLGAKYSDAYLDNRPQPSRMYRNFPLPESAT